MQIQDWSRGISGSALFSNQSISPSLGEYPIDLDKNNGIQVLKIHHLHGMNATRLTCNVLTRLIWVMLNRHIFTAILKVSQMDISFHKLCSAIKQNYEFNSGNNGIEAKPKEWLLELTNISVKHHRKDYKKGTGNFLKKLNIINCQSSI